MSTHRKTTASRDVRDKDVREDLNAAPNTPSGSTADDEATRRSEAVSDPRRPPSGRPGEDTSPEVSPEPMGDEGGRSAAVSPPARINLLEAWDDESDAAMAALSLVRLSSNETIVVPFSAEGSRVMIHYCDEPEINGYVQCNGEECLLCRLGRTQDERFLLPVFVPASRSIGILAISPSSRPGALRPQIMPVLRSGRRVALLIRRLDRVAYQVATADLPEDVDDGREIIADFARRWDSGQIDLATVYQRLDDRDLAEVAAIATVMKLKRIAL